MKTIQELEAENKKLSDTIENFYSNISALLLNKCALKVKVNDRCPYQDIVGKECFVVDLYPDGFTVWKPKEGEMGNFWRLKGEYLDVIEWTKDND